MLCGKYSKLTYIEKGPIGPFCFFSELPGLTPVRLHSVGQAQSDARFVDRK